MSVRAKLVANAPGRRVWRLRPPEGSDEAFLEARFDGWAALPGVRWTVYLVAWRWSPVQHRSRAHVRRVCLERRESIRRALEKGEFRLVRGRGDRVEGARR